ncbi:MAG: SMP-30/gluconolactonase/LRE family protein [Mesorhizobium sp.]|uniref:SMP-30/gluconolactonase/LRE family protein n=1 Tax=Mesorhizobium sp. TaxID=1871066 RepID=UPI000FE7A939|nr:SMP-30/gluconolactonase/LRE family protein [Mesorhizobium sp.]RWA79588.1 MAG: SMP-30/gluconolactonase/LRE family protein [Mesorhizobium sp.]TIU32749.1 MAG: SMP-30/gluconolactonase/LRE family protein [Mesorhizobium sp.]
MRLHHARTAFDCHNLLGEGCNWNVSNQSLLWTDIEAKCVFRWDDNKRAAEMRQLPDRAAFVFPRARGGFVLGFPKCVVVTDPTFTHFSQLAQIEPHLAQTRVNDAAIDPYGGIVLGTYNERNREPVGSVYRVAPDGEVVMLFGGVAAANGLAFSPDGRIMYFTDTAEGTIRRFALAPQFTGLAEIGSLAGPNIALGSPDGATVDIEGGYWSARLRGGCVVRIDRNGHLTDRVDMPSMAPTCVALGGKDLRTLFITSRRVRQSSDELLQFPESGNLFRVEVGQAGRSPFSCRV